jgi:hypothetical protein
MRIFVLPKALAYKAHDKKLTLVTMHITKPSNSVINFNTIRVSYFVSLSYNYELLTESDKCREGTLLLLAEHVAFK